MTPLNFSPAGILTGVNIPHDSLVNIKNKLNAKVQKFDKLSDVDARNSAVQFAHMIGELKSANDRSNRMAMVLRRSMNNTKAQEKFDELNEKVLEQMEAAEASGAFKDRPMRKWGSMQVREIFGSVARPSDLLTTP